MVKTRKASSADGFDLIRTQKEKCTNCTLVKRALHNEFISVFALRILLKSTLKNNRITSAR